MMQSTKLATKLATKKQSPHKPGSVMKNHTLNPEAPSEEACEGDNGKHDFQHVVQVTAGDTLSMVVDFKANNWAGGFDSNMTVVHVLPPQGTPFSFF